jgi:hypothetical protein
VELTSVFSVSDLLFSLLINYYDGNLRKHRNYRLLDMVSDLYRVVLKVAEWTTSHNPMKIPQGRHP